MEIDWITCGSKFLREFGKVKLMVKFLNHLQNNAPFSPDTQSLLSYTFQAIFELAVREPDSNANLPKLYKTSKELDFPLIVNVASFLLCALGRGKSGVLLRFGRAEEGEKEDGGRREIFQYRGFQFWLGLAVVLAYGLFDGVTYTTFFALAFLGYEKSTVKNPTANLQALLGVIVIKI
ncbi:unnamed protein product [Dovyalis caffra]|uniref:Uncharacterized protein n=1 Tax=Dovyalis caffra TaxID=77055 RepID=A0AAV1RYI5_9ROSI|nr:unnamed protein product [Dovyalis caffra]